MRRIDDDHVGPGFDKQRHPLVGVTGGTDRRTHPQCTATVLAGQRVIGRFLEILGRNHSPKLKSIVYHQHFLYTVSME